MFNGLLEDLARERMADHERMLAKRLRQREALACQRDYQDSVRKAPRPRLDPWLDGWRFVFGRK